MELGTLMWAWGTRDNLKGSSLVELPPLEQVWGSLSPSASLTPPLYRGPLEEGPSRALLQFRLQNNWQGFCPLLPCSGNQGSDFMITCTKSQSYALNGLLPWIFSRHLNNCVKCFALEDWEGSVLLHSHCPHSLGEATKLLRYASI